MAWNWRRSLSLVRKPTKCKSQHAVGFPSYTAFPSRALCPRLLDVFTSITCHSLQNHLRTSLPDIGQVETDEVYVGVDSAGRQYVLPVQAKGHSDEIGVVQIEQDLLLCKHHFPNLICKAIAAQFIETDLIALFEFIEQENEVKKAQERRYRLVSASEISDEELVQYSTST